MPICFLKTSPRIISEVISPHLNNNNKYKSNNKNNNNNNNNNRSNTTTNNDKSINKNRPANSNQKLYPHKHFSYCKVIKGQDLPIDMLRLLV